MKRLIIPTVIGLLFGTAAAADEGYDTEVKEPKLDSETAAIVFDNLDRNGDGLLDPDEAAALENITALYVEIDTDADGQLDREEFLVISEWEGELDDQHTALIVEVDSHLTAGSDTTAFNPPTEEPLDYDADWQDVNQDDPEATVEIEADSADEDSRHD